MNLSLKRTIFGHKAFVSVQIRRIAKVRGINSNLKDGKHILMWEWDITERQPVEDAIKVAQARWGLPDVYLVSSHPAGGFHAYCFKAVTFTSALHIVSGTAWIDPAYLRMSCIRQHMTLRLTDKGQGPPSYVDILPGYGQPTANYTDLASWVEYETYAKKSGILFKP